MGGFSKLHEKRMEALITLFAVLAIVGVGIAIWINTKPGKRWLANL